MAVTVLQPSSSSASLGLDDEIGTRQSAAVTAWAGLALVSRAVREDICPFLLNRPANRTSPAAARPWAGRCDAGPEHVEQLVTVLGNRPGPVAVIMQSRCPSQ